LQLKKIFKRKKKSLNTFAMSHMCDTAVRFESPAYIVDYPYYQLLLITYVFCMCTRWYDILLYYVKLLQKRHGS